MKVLLDFALGKPVFLVMPAVGFALSMVVLHIKRRYVNEGVLLRRLPTAEHVHHLAKSAKVEMNSVSPADLEIALRKFHELGLEDGDLGYAYWYEVGQLLKQAAVYAVANR